MLLALFVNFCRLLVDAIFAIPLINDIHNFIAGVDLVFFSEFPEVFMDYVNLALYFLPVTTIFFLFKASVTLIATGIGFSVIHWVLSLPIISIFTGVK